VLVVVVPVQVVSTLLTADYTASSLDYRTSFGTSSDQTPEQTLHQFDKYIGGLAISTVLQMLAVLLASAACFRAIAQAYLGEQADWRSSLSYALRHGRSLLWLSLLYFLSLMSGFVLFVVPGIWLYVALAFGTPALLVEGLRGRGALARSMQLVRGRWWRTCGVLLVGFVLSGIITAVVQGVFYLGILADADNDVLVVGLTAIAGTVGLAIGTPFQAALTTVIYFDLRVRKEAFDLELLATQIGTRVPLASAGSAPAPLLPEEEIDRTGAPYWPPPPGWKPPPRAVREDDASWSPPAPAAPAGDEDPFPAVPGWRPPTDPPAVGDEDDPFPRAPSG
jgi:hypothetical protein